MSLFNKKVGKKIPKEEATRHIDNWKKKSNIKTHSSFFGSDVINEILATSGCVGIRIHYGLDQEGNLTPILTPEVDQGVAEKASETGMNTYNASVNCPPYC